MNRRIVLDSHSWVRCWMLLIFLVAVPGGCSSVSLFVGDDEQTPTNRPFSLSAPSLLSTNTLSEATDAEVAFHYAPAILQDVLVWPGNSLGGKADFLSPINFDGDWNMANNWENVAKPTSVMRGTVYYSVVKSETHWFIIYGFYHPRDWSGWAMGAGFNPIRAIIGIGEAISNERLEHENDFEGALFIAARPPAGNGALQKFGKLCAVVTVAHHDFLTYIPSGSSWKSKRPLPDNVVELDRRAIHHTRLDNVTEILPMTDKPVDGVVKRAVLLIQSEGHAVYAKNPSNFPNHHGIRYVPRMGAGDFPLSTNEEPRNKTAYALVDIFEKNGLWERQLNHLIEAGDTFENWGEFKGDSKAKAQLPWAWKDKDDATDFPSLPKNGGYIATDPIAMVKCYFTNLGYFAPDYSKGSNPYTLP